MESIYIRRTGIQERDTIGVGKRYPVMRIVFILLLLQQALIDSRISGLQPISYLDEGVSAFLLLVFLWKEMSGEFRLQNKERLIVVLSFAVLILGFFSNLLFRLQPVGDAVTDAFTCFKFLFSYLGIRALYEGKISSTFLEDNFCGIARMFAVLFFVLTVYDSLFPPIFPRWDYRYFAYSIELFYGHPQHLAGACIILICVLASSLEKRKSDFFFIAMLSFVIFRTLRIKAIGFVAVFFLFLIIVYVFRIRSQFLLFLPLICCGLYVGWDQIQNYFFSSDEARAILTRDSFKIANRYFPFGSGFATFGSYAAYQNYSPLYWSFGYNHIYGMTKNAGDFLSDTFWPTVLAQFGYVGLILFLIIIFCFFRTAFQIQKRSRQNYVAALSILIYMIISSTSESAFFNPFAVLYFMIFGLLICQSTETRQPDAGEKSAVRKSKYLK